MSFMYVPALLRIPDVPGFSPPDGVWRGVGKDYGLFAFRPGTSSWGYSVMTQGSFVCSLMVDGYELKPVYSTVNGYIHWTGNGYLYNTIAYGWVYAAGKFAGYEPIEENISYDKDTGTYSAEGDSFWSLWGSPPCRPDEEVELVALFVQRCERWSVKKKRYITIQIKVDDLRQDRERRIVQNSPPDRI